MRLFQLEHRSQHTETLIHSIVADEISALGSLLCHERNDSTVGLDFLHGFGLFHEGINVVYDLNQVNNAVIAFRLSDDGLRRSQNIILIILQKKHALCVAERMFHAIFAYG